MDQASGATAASDNDIYANPPDVAELELEPGHPGLGDAAYIARRRGALRSLPRAPAERTGPPRIDYTDEEQRIWREVSPQLDALHVSHASRIYLQAKRDLGISAKPRSRSSATSAIESQERSGMHLVPGRGPIPYRTFYSYIAERGFPVTQFIRHGSKPEFTPEPDMIHDCLGHVPPLVNHDYAALLTMIGKAAVSVATGDQVLALKRLSWFSIEFGLIEEEGETRIFGAGILSSIGEIPLLAVDGRRAPAVRDRLRDRDGLRPLADAGAAVRDPVV